MELNIYHLYPDVLNLYGDRGNVLCMQRRLEWRGMQANIVPVPIGVKLAAKLRACKLLFLLFRLFGDIPVFFILLHICQLVYFFCCISLRICQYLHTNIII